MKFPMSNVTRKSGYQRRSNKGIVQGYYPLVICYIAMENGHRNSGFTH